MRIFDKNICLSQSGSYGAGGVIPAMIVETLTGNSGGAVGPDGSHNINVQGDNTTISVAGDPGTNTLTVSYIGGTGVTNITGNIGSSVNGGVSLLTANTNVPFYSSGSSVTLDFLGNPASLGNNILLGSNPGLNVALDTNNTSLGANASGSLQPSSGVQANTAVGSGAAYFLTTGSYNTAIGSSSLGGVTTGSNNVAIGQSAGSGWTLSDSSNIAINGGNAVSESNTLRIGNATGTGAKELSAAYICGIDGVDLNTVNVVTESGDQLGTAMLMAGANVTITKGVNEIIIASSGGGGSTTIDITGDTGGTLTSSAFTFTGGATGLTFNGVGSTETLSGTLAVSHGGTGVTSNTAYAVLCGGTTSTAAIQSVASVGTSGQVLTSNGAGALPTFQAAPASSISITGNSGGALTGNAFTFTGGTTGLTFAGAGTTETLGGTLAIANGGTNATSMSTSTGIVKYDGTSLVTSSTAKIDSSNRQTNTSQPAFMARLSSSTATNVTGDATLYTVICNTVVFDQNSNYSNSTGLFTAPITGKYAFNANITFIGAVLTSSLSGQLVFVCSDGRTLYNALGLYNSNAANANGYVLATGSILIDLAASATIAFKAIGLYSGNTKNMGIVGSGYLTYVSGYLVC